MPATVFLRVSLCGAFRVEDRAGNDLTPRVRKECAIIAILALSPGHTRSRRWIQDRLWSGRFDEQGRTSLRRALANLRKQLGAALCSDRNNVWLTGGIETDLETEDTGGLLDDLEIRDPEFEKWRRDVRRWQNRGDSAAPEATESDRLFTILFHDAGKTPEERYLLAFFCDSLAKHLNSFGDVDISNRPLGQDKAQAHLQFEVESVVRDGQWYIHLRCFSQEQKAFLWSGNLRLPLDFGQISRSPDLAAFLTRATSSVEDRFGRNALALSIPYFQIQQAMRQLYTGRRTDLLAADAVLSQVRERSAMGVVLAMRGYIRLIDSLEYFAAGDRLMEEASGFAAESISLAPQNALVLGLAAQVQIKVVGDNDYGSYLARNAFDHGEQNPFALHALSQANQLSGRAEQAYDSALWARKVARGGTNGFCWDMQASLAALGLGRIDEAMIFLRDAHHQQPNYRPALRYLFALSSIAGRGEDAARYLARLAAVEPDFAPENMLAPDYPLHTLRNLGLSDALRESIANGITVAEPERRPSSRHGSRRRPTSLTDETAEHCHFQ